MLYKLRTGLPLMRGLVRKYRLLLPITLLRTAALQWRWKHIHFSVQHGIHLCSLLPLLNNGMYSQPVKSCSSPAATGAPCSAVPRHPHQSALAGCLSKNQRNLNLMIRDQDCRQGPSEFCDGVSGARTCVWSEVVMGSHISDIFLAVRTRPPKESKPIS